MPHRTRQMVAVVTVALGFVVALAGSAQAQGNSSLGTWKLNLAKSSFDPGPPPKSHTRVYEAWEKDGIKATFTIVGADGKTTLNSFTAHYDGKENKYVGSPEYDTILITRVDATTVDSTQKLSGKTVIQTRSVNSADGKTRTFTSNGTNLKGQKVHNVQVFDKQ